MKINSVFIKLIKGQGNPYKWVNDILRAGSATEFERLSHLLCKNNVRTNDILYNRMFPETFLFIKYPYYDGINQEKLLLWDTFLIKGLSKQINNFINLKRDFENSILMHDYKCAHDTLELVESNYGRSLWLLESKMLLSSLGVKNDYTNLRDFDKLFLSYLSYKNDFHIRRHLYQERMKRTIRKNIAEEQIVSFFDYKFFVERENLNWNDVLFFGNQFSLIDIYLLVVDILQELKKLDVNKTIIDMCFNNLSNVDDENISIIRNRYYSNDYDFEFDEIENNIKSFDIYYTEVSDEIVNNKNKYIQSIYAYLLLNIASMNTKTNLTFGDCLASEILGSIKDLMQKQNKNNVINSINKLYVFSRVFSSFSIGKSILIILNDIIDDDELISDICKFSSIIDIHLYYAIKSSDSNMLLPEKMKSLSIDELTSSNYMEWFSNRYNSNAHPSYYYYKEAYVSLKIEELINCKQYDAAIEAFVSAYIDNNMLIFAFDITVFVNYIKEKIQSRIPLSIEEVCYISIDNQLNKYLKSSFLNLLDNENASQLEPLEYIKNCSSNDSIKCFFLHSICTVDMLKKIYWLNNSSLTINEYRIKICQYILNVNANISKKELNKEIEDLTKKNIIKERLQKIDGSRVTIQSAVIQDLVFEEISDLVSRYNRTAKEEKVIVSYDSNNPASNTYVYLRQSILSEIYETYAKAFCFSDFGIDTSLSTRVRHGAFTNQIINVLNNYGFFSIDDVNDSIICNLVELNVFNSDIDNCFKTLYKRVTEILEYTKKNSLKVILNEYIEGAIFNYSLSAVDEENLFSSIEKNNRIDFEETTIIINQFLINKTNEHLKYVRDNLLNKVLENINRCLDEFNKDILKCLIVGYSKNSKIINREIVNCKTELQTEIGNIKQWFYLSENKNWENYSFNDLLDIINEINKKLFIHYEDIHIIVNNADVVLKGATFRNFVDIYSILFNNAITHSGFTNKLSELNISLKTFTDNESIHLVFTNNIDNSIEIAQLDEKINELNEAYKSKKYLDINSRQEGGMGLYKIMHMIFSTNQYGKRITFYRSENTFNVDIQFGKEIIYDESITG